MILVTGATGMFGGLVTAELADRGAPVRALVHSPERVDSVRRPNVQPVIGDMADRASLDAAMEGVERLFLVSPMAPGLAERETNVIDAARDAGVEQVVKLFGAVRHHGDPLDVEHRAVIDHLAESDLRWALISPQTVMETNLLPQAEAVKAMGSLFGAAGDGRVAMVAAGDCARAAAVVLTADPQPHDGANHEITGPEALTFAEIAERIGRALGREISYVDMPEEQLRDLLVQQAGYPADRVEIEVLVHYRLFKEGAADVVTDTYEELTGDKPTSVEQFVAEHRAAFGG